MAMYKFYSGTTSGTPIEYDVEADLGRKGATGYIKNRGNTNSILVELSDDGVNYGDAIDVAPGDAHIFAKETLDVHREPRINIVKIRVTQSVSGSAFICYVD